MVARHGISLRCGKIGASVPILPNFAGRPRSANRHGVLEGGPSAGADGEVKPARGVLAVPLGLAHAEEDPDLCRAAGRRRHDGTGTTRRLTTPVRQRCAAMRARPRFRWCIMNRLIQCPPQTPFVLDARWPGLQRWPALRFPGCLPFQFGVLQTMTISRNRFLLGMLAAGTVYSQETLTADNYGRDFRLTNVHGKVVKDILV